MRPVTQLLLETIKIEEMFQRQVEAQLDAFEDLAQGDTTALQAFAIARTKLPEVAHTFVFERMPIILEEHVSEEDLEFLLNFYKSSVGERLLKLNPTLEPIFQRIGAQLGEELDKQVAKEMGLES